MLQKSSLFAAALTIAITFLSTPGATAQDRAEADPPRKLLQMVELDFGGEEKPVESTRTASWFLGKKLSLLLILKARGAAEESYRSLISESGVFAAALDIELPAPPKISGLKDIWTARDYLIKKGEGSVLDIVLAKHGEDCAAIFGLAAEAVSGGLLYSAELGDADTTGIQKEINQNIVDRIKVGVMRSRFHDEKALVDAAIPIISWIENLKPEGQDFSKQLIGFTKAIETALMSESDAASPDAPAPAPPSTPAAVTPEATEAKEILAQFVAPGADVRTLTTRLTPTPEAAKKLFAGDLAGRSAKVYSKLFSDPQMTIEPGGERTEIILKWITSDELKAGSEKARDFPGGYKSIAPQLRPGFTIYEFSFVKPGAERGLRFDGLVKIDGAWHLFPKMWRLLDEQPFGLEIE